MGQGRIAAPVWGVVGWCALALLVLVPCCSAQDAAAVPPSASIQDPTAVLPPPDATQQDVLDMNLEQLVQADVLVGSLEEMVTSVSRQESTVGRSPTAIFVITPEMIRRSGAREIPEVLRMVPGVEVARINANMWAVSIRGFNNRFESKLLVQIDGRQVYRQAFNGVFWDEQDVVLEDVERIEVIRGPGATVWGANAVNGVINIITKQAKDTQGVLVNGGAGTEERGFSTVRYGGRIGDDVYWRVYGKQFERDGGAFDDGEFDDWRQGRGGFRVDMTPTSDDTITLQGDFFEGQSGSFEHFAIPRPPFQVAQFMDTYINGQDFLMRWTRVLDDETDWSFQAYYDRINRRSPTVDEGQEVFDLDYQYRFPIGQRHNVICGAGYRQIEDHLFGPFWITVTPPIDNKNLFGYFVQDEVELEEDRWYLTAGSKFEHNDFTGFEFQPSVRLLHLPSKRESVWMSVSRAVRTPGRIEEDALIYRFSSPVGPVLAQFRGNGGLAAEDLLAFEWGYRAQPNDDFSWDLTTFYNHYEDLIGGLVTGPPFFDPTIGAIVVPAEFANTTSANTYGAELSSTLRLSPRWELSGAYTLLYMEIGEPSPGLAVGSDPHNQVYLMSTWTGRPDWELNLIGRYVDNLPALGVPSYVTMDLRYAWRPRPNMEWSLVGRNLLGNHIEWVDLTSGAGNTEIQPEMYLMLTWTY